jgi:hypothetical protein
VGFVRRGGWLWSSVGLDFVLDCMQLVITNPIVQGITVWIVMSPASGLGFALVINITAFVMD